MRISRFPAPYEAAIAVSDDPDNSTLASFTAMYDFLAGIGFPTTRAMWTFEREEFTGTPPLPIEFSAPLLKDPDCLDYCRRLRTAGFEICLHGASSGNNTRERTVAALDALESSLGASPVFVFHSKNAENLYWDASVASSKIGRALLGLYTRNRCFGEVSGSRYFWGDVCRERVRFIRMFRTRRLDTLAENPSMPYHDFRKPFVNFWFSATKGHIPRLFAGENIERLRRRNGASVLYQYLDRYVDAEGRIPADVREALERVASDGRIWKAPVSALLERLRRTRLVLIHRQGERAWIVNAGRKPLEEVQVCGKPSDGMRADAPFRTDPGRGCLILSRLEPLSVVRVDEAGASPGTTPEGERGVHVFKFAKGTAAANLADRPVEYRGSDRKVTIAPRGVHVEYLDPEAARLEVLEPPPRGEIRRMMLAQGLILLREHVLLGRKVSVRGYLRDTGKVESQRNW